jgi:hypothetical protein
MKLMLCAMTFALSAMAADVEGYLLDKACSAEVMQKGQKAAAGHDKGCAMMGECRASGFGVLTSDGRFLKFDAAGDRQAVGILRKAKKETDLRVKVSGDVQGGAMKVASLSLLP